MRDISLIIPHRDKTAMGLWMSIHSAEEDLQRSGLDYEFVIASNGAPIDDDTSRLIQSVESSGHLGKHLHYDTSVAPPLARSRAAEVASGRILMFCDNHVMFGKDYFKRIAMDMESDEVDIVHPAVTFYSGDRPYYEYALTLAYNFWGTYKVVPQFMHKPYKVACAGHGAFAVKKTAWDVVGGYGPENLLVGYGGEELLFNLKCWLYGKAAHLDPKAMHYHYPGVRSYTGKYTDDYYTNMLVCANVIGGEDWMYKVYDSFAGSKQHVRCLSSELTMFDLLQVAHERSKDYAAEVAAKRVMSLDELLVYFKQHCISV